MRNMGKRPLFWKSVDYIWLGVAGLTLISATNEVRRLIAKNTSDNEKTYFEGQLNSTLYIADFGRTYFNIWHRNQWKIENESEKLVSIQYDSVVNWFSNSYNQLLLPPKTQPWKSIDTNSAIFTMTSDPTVSLYKKKISKNIDALDSSYKDLQEVLQSMERSDFEVVLFVFMPWLFAVALALKITKVTADMKGFSSD